MIRYSLFVIRYSLFVIRYSLFVIRYSLFVIRYSLFVIRYSLFVIHYSLFIIPRTFALVDALGVVTGGRRLLWADEAREMRLLRLVGADATTDALLQHDVEVRPDGAVHCKRHDTVVSLILSLHAVASRWQSD